MLRNLLIISYNGGWMGLSTLYTLMSSCWTTHEKKARTVLFLSSSKLCWLLFLNPAYNKE